jgi:hypothetical protein
MNQVTSQYISTQLLSEISNRINLHHSLYKTLTIKDKYWEYILVESYRSIGFNVDYDVENHASGKDLVVKNAFNDGHELRVSCKSGKIGFSKRKNKIVSLEISSYRTTKYESLEEKLNYIDGDHEDVVFSLSSTLFNSHKKYILTVLTPPKFKNLGWSSNKGGYFVKTNDLSAKINKQCSDQLWYTMKYDSSYVLETYDVCMYV